MESPLAEPDRSSLHPLLAARRSPRAFDPRAAVTEAETALLLEAARWAPSDFNTQPWRFLVARKDSDAYKQIFTRLTERNQRWAGRASLLLAVGLLARDEAGSPFRCGEYDLGQAVAHLTLQATALDLYVHQIAGFDASALHADLGLPEQVCLKVVVAVGRLGDPATLPPDLQAREAAARERQPVTALLLR